MLAARARLDDKNQQKTLVRGTTSSESRSEANSSSSQNDDVIDPVQVSNLQILFMNYQRLWQFELSLPGMGQGISMQLSMLLDILKAQIFNFIWCG